MHPTDLVPKWPAPAAGWTEAAPVGNGRLGATVLGGAEPVRIRHQDRTAEVHVPAGTRTTLDADPCRGEPVPC